jgi:hypothetical protein
MRTFVYTVTVAVGDDAINGWSAIEADEQVSDMLDTALREGIGDSWLSGRSIVDDGRAVEVLPEITEVHGQRLYYDAPAEAVIADQREVIALAEALAPVGWESTGAGWPEGE